MTAHTRVNSFHWYDSDTYSVFFDYDAQNRIVGMTVENDVAGQTVYAKVVTSKTFNGVNTFSQAFTQGTASVQIPTQSGVTVSFDPNDGNAPALAGIVSIDFSTSPIA